MCGIKPCASCAQKSIGKMAKKKSVRRRRRVGAISKADVMTGVKNGGLAIAGALVANLLAGAINKDGKKWMSSVPQLVAGIGLGMTSNPMARAAGVGMMVIGGNNLLKDLDVKLPGMAGVGFPRLGYNPRLGLVPPPQGIFDAQQG